MSPLEHPQGTPEATIGDDASVHAAAYLLSPEDWKAILEGAGLTDGQAIVHPPLMIDEIGVGIK